jgi:hypothetical protein
VQKQQCDPSHGGGRALRIPLPTMGALPAQELLSKAAPARLGPACDAIRAEAAVSPRVTGLGTFHKQWFPGAVAPTSGFWQQQQ